MSFLLRSSGPLCSTWRHPQEQSLAPSDKPVHAAPWYLSVTSLTSTPPTFSDTILQHSFVTLPQVWCQFQGARATDQSSIYAIIQVCSCWMCAPSLPGLVTCSPITVTSSCRTHPRWTLQVPPSTSTLRWRAHYLWIRPVICLGKTLLRSALHQDNSTHFQGHASCMLQRQS